ncbi:MAG: hypothetical protein DSM106950_33875 [Stigonema ocellatum SAG 48.90 = DSM 106950]|nr:hypothetical protein [Stigonema ocellatum SAG 48.90 = DSM 106950]
MSNIHNQQAYRLEIQDGIFAVAESGYEFTSRKVKAGRAPASGDLNCRAKAQRERVLKYPIFSFHTSIQQRRIFHMPCW